MIQGQGQNLVGCKPGAILVDNPKAVCIAIQSKAQGGFAGLYTFAYIGHARFVGLRRFAAKERVGSFMKARDLGPGFLKERIQIITPGSVHQLHGNFHLGLLDGLKINELA